MNKEEIKKRLQQNRQEPIVKKENWTMVELGRSVQIATKGGSFYENLVVVRGQGKYAIVQYKGSLPKQYDLRENNRSDKMVLNLVDKKVADVVEDAIDTWGIYYKYHLSAYTFIVTYCLTRDVDLIKMDVFEL